MRDHWTGVLILCAVALAACQPGSQGAVQTQAAQSAFNNAVARAQTQAAPPIPTQTFAPSPTSVASVEPSPTQPIPTVSADHLNTMAHGFRNYLQDAIGGFHPTDGAPYAVQVSFVEFEYYDGGNAAVMDVGIQKSDETNEAAAEGAALNAFTAIYGTAIADEHAWGQVLFLPRQLRTFRVHIYDSGKQERFRLSGNWEDIIAYGKGALSKDEFIKRLTFEIAK